MADIIDREVSVSALADAFKQCTAHMKAGFPVWEDFLGRGFKLHRQLDHTVSALESFVEGLSKVADMAARGKAGGVCDIAAGLSSLVNWHRAQDFKLKEMNLALSSKLLDPLQSKIEEWKKTTSHMDREHEKEVQRTVKEIRENTKSTMKTQKKLESKLKKDKIEKASALRHQLEQQKKDVCRQVCEAEKRERLNLNKVLLEERRWYGGFVAGFSKPLDVQVSLFGDVERLKVILVELSETISQPDTLPSAAKEFVEGWSFPAPNSPHVNRRRPSLQNSSASLSSSHSLSSLSSQDSIVITAPAPPPQSITPSGTVVQALPPTTSIPSQVVISGAPIPPGAPVPPGAPMPPMPPGAPVPPRAPVPPGAPMSPRAPVPPGAPVPPIPPGAPMPHGIPMPPAPSGTPVHHGGSPCHYEQPWHAHTNFSMGGEGAEYLHLQNYPLSAAPHAHYQQPHPPAAPPGPQCGFYQPPSYQPPVPPSSQYGGQYQQPHAPLPPPPPPNFPPTPDTYQDHAQLLHFPSGIAYDNNFEPISMTSSSMSMSPSQVSLSSHYSSESGRSLSPPVGPTRSPGQTRAQLSSLREEGGVALDMSDLQTALMSKLRQKNASNSSPTHQSGNGLVRDASDFPPNLPRCSSVGSRITLPPTVAHKPPRAPSKPSRSTSLKTHHPFNSSMSSPALGLGLMSPLIQQHNQTPNLPPTHNILMSAPSYPNRNSTCSSDSDPEEESAFAKALRLKALKKTGSNIL